MTSTAASCRSRYGRMTLLIDLIAAASAPLLTACVAVYAAAVLHLVAWDIERARWQRQFGGWRALQHDRITGRGAPAIPLLRLLRASFARRLAERPSGSGWRAVQQHRIERRAVR